MGKTSSQQILFDLGTIINPSRDNSNNETLIITYTAMVLDTQGNQQGTQLNNSAKLTWLQGSGMVGDRVWFDVDKDGVQDTGEPGLVGVPVTLTWAGADGDLATTTDNQVYTTATTADGIYHFTGLPAGKYKVSVDDTSGSVLSNKGFSIGTPSASATPPKAHTFDLIAGQNLTDKDFGAIATSSLGDTVWFDLDKDGVKDTGEAGVANAKVKIEWAGLDGNLSTSSDNSTITVTTNSSGAYSLTQIPGGTYRVSVLNADNSVYSTQTKTIAGGATENTFDFPVTFSDAAGKHVKNNALKSKFSAHFRQIWRNI